jgi:hypothetical protein
MWRSFIQKHFRKSIPGASGTPRGSSNTRPGITDCGGWGVNNPDMPVSKLYTLGLDPSALARHEKIFIAEIFS